MSDWQLSAEGAEKYIAKLFPLHLPSRKNFSSMITFSSLARKFITGSGGCASDVGGDVGAEEAVERRRSEVAMAAQ